VVVTGPTVRPPTEASGLAEASGLEFCDLGAEAANEFHDLGAEAASIEIRKICRQTPALQPPKRFLLAQTRPKTS
jgi:hypothetical protein